MATLAKFDGLELPPTADFHVHLRDGEMMETVVPCIRKGGVDTVMVMPNLVPPITSATDAISYKERLQKHDQDGKVNFLMTLYLHESITPDHVRLARAQGIVGIKSYPAGVTTNSSSGVLSYEPFYPVFEAMEECGMVLNLHGECPSGKDITILNAETSFLPTLKSLHAKFPKLKIVLEHCTTSDALEAVKACGPNVVGTITAHHLFLIIDDWADDPFCYCKPVAKLPRDRAALLRAVVSGSGKFFLGSDSAPHDLSQKKGGRGKIAAGVFTQLCVTQYVLSALELAIERGVLTEADVTEDVLRNFLGEYGRQFYGITSSQKEKIVLRKGGAVVQESLKGNGVEVIPFRRGQATWSIEWK